MSTHPNVMLIARLSPNGLPRKTFLAILADAGKAGTDASDVSDASIKIGEDDFKVLLMDDDWHDDYQISAKDGEIVLMDMVTYGYGEAISWDDLCDKRNALGAWIAANTERYQLAADPQICVSANYW